MISIPGSLYFVMSSAAPAKENLRGMPDTRPKIHPLIHSGNQRCPMHSRLQSVLVVSSSFVERSNGSVYGVNNYRTSSQKLV